MVNYQLPPLPPRGRGRPWATAARAIRAGLAGSAAYKLRAGLTMLGVIIVVCGVLTISAFGQVANGLAAESLAQFGTTLVSVSAVEGTGAPALPLTEQDVQAIRQLPHVLAASPMRMDEEQAGAGNQSWSTAVSGVYPEMQAVLNLSTSAGAFFTAQDEQSGAPVAIIGRSMATQLFGGSDPIGQQVRLRNVNFRVVGVLVAKGHNGQQDLDDVVLIPFSTGQQRLFGYAGIGGLLLQADSTSNLPQVVTGINRVLRSTRHIAAGRPDDFRVTNYQQLVDSARQQAAAITMIMSAIAAVALTLGGFGLMNIMLMAVTDRTTEIGVRMAVGAQPGDVLLQFLSEAATLTIIGGLLGVVAGFAASAAIPYLAKPLANYPAWPAPGAIAVALGVSLAVGLLFGLYPAHRAAHLNPIEALRYE